jgi:hypothetical protein
VTFTHVFSRRVRCTLTTTDEAPPQGGSHVVNCEWTGQFKPKHIPAYRQWILCTNQILADRWQIKMLYALGTHHNRTELWCFEPGGVPKLLERLNVGLPS